MPEHAPKRVAVAVQGGGAHGAFSWGALDRLLEYVEQGKLIITALSGTSAGGFNAALCAYALGFDKNQASLAKNARQLLREYWMADAADAPFSAYSATAKLWHDTFNSWNIDSSPTSILSAVNNQIWSPIFYLQYDWLAQVLGNKIDFDKLQRQTEPPELYIATTNITAGRRDIFAKSAVTLDVLKASACIPQLFLPAKYENNYYWDGGFMGNPAITPLINHSSDVVLIQLNPFSRDTPPYTAMEINNRVNEITFNSSLVHEINAICAVNKLIDYFDALAKTSDAAAQAAKLLPVNRVRLTRITNEPFMRRLGYASKSVIVKDFLLDLYKEGWTEAGKWFDASYSSLADTEPAPRPAMPAATDTKKPGFPADILDTLLSRKNIIRKRHTAN
ncbi:patatin-like phospholipase family protein [Burkholderia sp. Ac-20365]|uniref:patatin-like phospholipase family protein n=1 Tax=Burkholderia sp. Ac-20365 TaxID=2703897 RepID=UPI00197C5E6A|nr:patatin-like phospholipase family protein [Burkholderia sp. Ac-20365]MBN3763862.1 patatin-like phospholipase family protein [Burkholderia sp. Ac-20365]